MHTLSEAKKSEIERKVERGDRLTYEDGVALLLSCGTQGDLLWLGRLADTVRRRKSGDAVYFVRNRHINHTNICKNRCLFCAFSRDEGEPGAFRLSIDEIVARAKDSLSDGVTEFHVVGGEDPAFGFEDAIELVSRLHELAPHATVVAFTASEIAHFSAQARLDPEEVLLRLKQAGLGALPGGGAEVFSPRVRSLLCPRKVSAETWLSIHKAAHRAGLRTNATMLYGHIETAAERVDHLLRLRALQDETGGFQAFIPLSFHPKNTRLSYLPGPTGTEDLAMIAVSRLVLDNVPHIKAYWVMLGVKLAQAALSFGADDLEGTVVEEVITTMAGGAHEGGLTVEDLVHIIKAGGFVPVERDSFYRVVRVYE